LAPFQYYGAANEGNQNKIIQEIVETLQKKDQFSLVVKLHPSIPYLEYFNHMIHSIDDSIEIFQKGSIEKYIDEADLLITNGIFSSSAIYALALHKPVIFCNFYNLYSYDEYTNIIFECRNSTELVNVINTAYTTNNKKFQNIEKFLEQHYFKTDGRSSERVVNAIKQLVENKNTN